VFVNIRSLQTLTIGLTLLLGAGAIRMGEAATDQVAGLPAAEALRLGERIYRQGLGVDGSPITAIVAGDIPVDGRMFTCVDCHQRSGLGTVEGSVITWPVNGKELFVPRRRTGAWSPTAAGRGPGAPERWSLPPQYQVPDARPAYTADTLAHALRTGEDPAGRKMNLVMPRYDLNERDMAVLIHYLEQLSDDLDPGVDEETLRFATVVTEGIDPTARDAMLSVLRAHIDARNTQTRPHLRRARQGPFYKTEKFGAYRKLELDVWQLAGPADTWTDQLAGYYEKRPVFALLGGIGAGSWEPVHDFCEERGIPSILPLADRPVVSDTDWYTLYFSKGVYQEGEAAARFLQSSTRVGTDSRILQVFRSGQKGEDAAQGFQQSWEDAGNSATGLVSTALSPGEAFSDLLDVERAEGRLATVLLLWLEGDEAAAALSAVQEKNQGIATIFLSSTLLGKDLRLVPEAMRDRVYLTYPYSLPEESEKRLRFVNRWLKARKIPPTDPEIQAKMYFLGWMLPGALSYMRSEFYRDYFLEGFDMMTDQDYAIPIYPRLTFGPGQRYASKGCYIVQLGAGDQPKLLRLTDWVIN